MKNTTLCYIEKDGKYLMLYRNKKCRDENEGKYIGIGGKFEEGESPEECMLREVYEETGLAVSSYEYKGIITFKSDIYETEYMHLFYSRDFSGEIKKDCDEGELIFIPKEKIRELTLWEGDLIFLSLMEKNVPFFSLKLEYRGDKLIKALLSGEELSLPFEC